jgi:phosphatidylinositol N-acetylglucosaminyltransferase subunit P
MPRYNSPEGKKSGKDDNEYSDEEDNNNAFSSPTSVTSENSEKRSPNAISFVGMSKMNDEEITPFPTAFEREKANARDGDATIHFIGSDGNKYEYFNNNRTNTSPSNVNNNNNNSSVNQNKSSNNISNNNIIPEKGLSNNINNVGNNNSTGANLEKPASLRVHALNVKLKEYEAPKLTEVYGFVGWMLSWLALAVFFLWAFLPEEIWKQFGVTYYPNKYWALALPAYLLMSYFFLCIIHVGIALVRTPPFSSASLISDEFTREARDFSRLAKSAKSTVGTPEIYDIPLSVTNRLIYSRGGKNSSGYKSTRYRYRFGQSRSSRKSHSKHSDLHPTAKQYNINDASNNTPSSIFPTGLQRIRSLPTQ